MTSIKQESNVIQYRKQKHLNIGIIIFGIIFIYLIATIIMYLFTPRITVYEVRQGSILKDNAYTGLAIREETIVYADAAGYANYYIEDNSKVRVGSKVYTLSDEKLDFEESVSDAEIAMTKEESHAILLKIQAYNNQFQEADFTTTYQLKDDIQNSLNRIASHSKSDQLDDMLSSGMYQELTVKTAAKDGVIVYAVDGLEDVTVDKISTDQLHKKNYKKTTFSANHFVTSGKPVYKLITDNNWKLLVEISEDTKEALLVKKSVKVNFKKDNQELWANLSFVEQAENPVACLSFSDSMIRYINDRYLDIELILEDESGLKIPKSAETSKEFYVVPKSYLTQGGNSSSDGVMRQSTDADGNKITEFLSVTVYYEEDEVIYLDPNAFHKNDVLLKPDSAETFALKEKRSLDGVFCINKGYAVFKQIHILCESDEYYIIEEGNSFGLSNYDHIALDSSSIKENDVVF